MSKHTAGKWSVGGKDSSIVYSALDGYAVASCAVYHGRFKDGEVEANARLISAAPELLEACQTFAEWLRRESEGFSHLGHDRNTTEGEAAWREWYYGNLEICDLAQEQARAAIAKAEGNDKGLGND